MSRPAIAVLIDALGWELVQRHGFLQDLCPRRTPVRTILGYSSAAIPSLLTGADPSETGMWSLFYRTSGTSPFAWTKAFTWLPERVYENRYTRWLIRKSSHALSGYSGYFYTYSIPIKLLQKLDVSERRSIYRPGAFDNGCRSIFDRLEERRIPYRSYSYHDGADDRIVARAAEEIRAGGHQFSFVYLSGLDAALHREVKSPERVADLLRQYDSLVRRLHDAAAAHGECDLCVFSDHGMTPITECFDLLAVLRQAGLREGTDYLGLFDSTMARFWFPSDAARERTVACLGSIRCGEILTDERLRAEGVYFDDRRYGELVFLMQPGTLIVPSHMGLRPLAGMHGFDPDDRHSTAMFMTNRPEEPQVRHLKGVVREILT